MIIYFCDLSHDGRGMQSTAMPLGAGMLAAAAQVYLDAKVEVFKRPSEFNDAVLRTPPNVVALSLYHWNTNLSMMYADWIREEYPSITLLFGGPNCEERGDENTLLKAFGHPGDIPFSELPSPYLLGIMDKFFLHHPELAPTMEIVRGCPYSCTYCSSSLMKNIEKRSSSVIEAELEYTAMRSRHPVLMIAHDNFGDYDEDLEAAKTIRRMIDRYGWPQRIETSTGKTHIERVIQITDIINRGLGKKIIKLGYSFQSTDPEVCRNIKRKNLPIGKLKPLQDYHKENPGLEFFSEIILGLPGETRLNYLKSLRDIIDILGANNVDIHQLTLLKGTEMEKTIAKEDTKKRVVIGCFGKYQVGQEIKPCWETEEIVAWHRYDYAYCRNVSLAIKVFWDQEPFREIFALVPEWMSRLDILLECVEDKRLRSLFGSYEKAQIDNLIDKKPVDLGSYMDGTAGKNELIAFRAVAWIKHGGDLKQILVDSILKCLGRKMENASIRYEEELFRSVGRNLQKLW